MDSRIVYCTDEKYRAELEKLRDEVRKTLQACQKTLRNMPQEGTDND